MTRPTMFARGMCPKVRESMTAGGLRVGLSASTQQCPCAAAAPPSPPLPKSAYGVTLPSAWSPCHHHKVGQCAASIASQLEDLRVNTARQAVVAGINCPVTQGWASMSFQQPVQHCTHATGANTMPKIHDEYSGLLMCSMAAWHVRGMHRSCFSLRVCCCELSCELS